MLLKMVITVFKVILDILFGRVDEETIDDAKTVEFLDIDAIKIVAGGNKKNLKEVNKLAKEALVGKHERNIPRK